MTETLADLIEARFGLPSEVGRDRVAEGELASLLTHRTHRRFTDAPVSDEMVELILACAFSAPSKSDLQQAAMIRIEDPEKRRAIAELIPSMPWIGTVPVFWIVCGDNRRIRRICELRGPAFANDTLDSVLNAAVDAALVLQNAIRAATALGLGCCPISVVRNHIEAISELLALPDCVFPVAGLCIGHPAHSGYVSMRLPLSVSVHTDSYDDSDLDAEINAYDRRRDAVYSIPPEKQRHLDSHGKPDFYGWSEDKARQVSLPEREQLRAFLQAHGFSLD
ncbi:MAG: nitroreductase family protein [Alphaproteobacteria bacterium]|jgi:nitroreductase/FMN reductase [NAD(P)H]|nr:nitroreductase family protein [Alphaproteobacteria bacterium]